MTESIMIALVEELKKLNINIEEHNDILLSHFAAMGELDMELVEFPEVDLDS